MPVADEANKANWLPFEHELDALRKLEAQVRRTETNSLTWLMLRRVEEARVAGGGKSRW
jgi:hypothetical protein